MKFKLQSLWILFFFLCGAGSDCLANQEPTELQKTNWLRKGSIAEKNRAYQSEEILRFSTPASIVRRKYKRINPDGTIWFRQETELSPGITKVTLHNADGIFEIVGNDVIKNETPNALPQQTVSAKPRRRVERIDADTILVDQKTKISRKENPQTFADIEKLLDEQKRAEQPPPFKEIIYLGRACYIISQIDSDSGETKLTVIDQKDHFILRQQVFDRNGKLNYERKVTSLVLDPKLPDELFATPEKQSVTTVKDRTELMDQQKAALDHALHAPKGTPKSVRIDYDSLLRYGPYLLAALGLCCILATGYLKMKERSGAGSQSKK